MSRMTWDQEAGAIYVYATDEEYEGECVTGTLFEDAISVNIDRKPDGTLIGVEVHGIDSIAPLWPPDVSGIYSKGLPAPAYCPHCQAVWAKGGHLHGLTGGDDGEDEPDDYLCPNCQTPWKCNGPHIPFRR